MKYDVFISHASEDKDEVARPLALRLEERGLRVWLDECQLTVGDNLRRSIDSGLADSRFGVLVLSPAFFNKEWPNKELDGLVAREDGNLKVILPVWHKVTAADIRRFSPILADRVAVSTSQGVDEVAEAIFEAIGADAKPARSPQVTAAEHEAEVLSRLRRQMLTAPGVLELRRARYELDEYLAVYPYSTNARMFKDELAAAIARAESMKPSVAQAPEVAAPPFRFGYLSIVAAVAVVAIIVVLLFVFLADPGR